MPTTIDGAFFYLLRSLTPSSMESEAAKKHRASIKGCLEANFGTLRAYFRAGSFGNGTSVSGYSDVDYLAGLPDSVITQRSDSLLSKVKVALDARFPKTGVHIDTPAVVVPFGSAVEETTEVVPAEFVETTRDGHRVFNIAGGEGEWMKTSPDAHNAYVKTQDDRLGGKLKPLIRFVKAWNFYKGVGVRSFYLEMRVAKYAEGEKAIVYSIDVRNVLKLLVDKELARLQDPTGISGYIAPCTPAKVADALSKANTALTHADRARAAETRGDIKEAFRQWDIVYGYRFPSYG